jgi:cell division protein FtsW
MISRASQGDLADWWWTVDRLVFFVVIGLVGVGLVLAFAASPAASGGPLSGGDFRYAVKQIAFALLAVCILIGASCLKPAQVGRVALYVFLFGLVGSAATLFLGEEVLGARRWLNIAGMTLQPSEFLKPGFAVLAATILAVPADKTWTKPFSTATPVLLAAVVLLQQPDVGQTFLLLALWAALLFFAGQSLKWIWAICGGAIGFATAAFFLFPHVNHRIRQFIDVGGEGYQVDLSLRAFAHGGLFGVGPGAGSVKYRLPDAHSDFIFAVAGEEYGFLVCALIAALFCVLAVRLMLRAADQRDTFSRLAAAGLATVVALQAFINMGVAVNLLPAKGMTLPFISYGGSSLFAVALTMGFALALTRRRSQLERREQPFAFMKGAAE